MHRHTNAHMCTHAHTCTDTHMHRHAHTHRCTCTHMYTDTQIHTCTYVHTCTRRHTQAPPTPPAGSPLTRRGNRILFRGPASIFLHRQEPQILGIHPLEAPFPLAPPPLESPVSGEGTPFLPPRSPPCPLPGPGRREPLREGTLRPHLLAPPQPDLGWLAPRSLARGSVSPGLPGGTAG